MGALGNPYKQRKSWKYPLGFVACPQVIGVVKVLAPTHLHEFCCLLNGIIHSFRFFGTHVSRFHVHWLVVFQICKAGSPKIVLYRFSVILVQTGIFIQRYCILLDYE